MASDDDDASVALQEPNTQTRGDVDSPFATTIGTPKAALEAHLRVCHELIALPPLRVSRVDVAANSLQAVRLAAATAIIACEGLAAWAPPTGQLLTGILGTEERRMKDRGTGGGL